MQNEESYVAQGRDNTGAAAVLRLGNPYADGFRYHDMQGAQKEKRRQQSRQLVDSLGRDLEGMSMRAWERDHPEIRKAMDEFVNYQVDLMARNVDLNDNPQAWRDLKTKKQDVIDLVSKSIEDKRTYEAVRGDMMRNPYLYKEEDRAGFDGWQNTPLGKRVPDPGVRRMGVPDYASSILKVAGNPYHTVTVPQKNADGTTTMVTRQQVDQAQLDRSFENWAQMGQQGNDPAYYALEQLAQDEVRTAAAVQGVDFDAMPPEQQAAMVTPVLKQMYQQIPIDHYATRSADTIKKTPTADQDNSAGGAGFKVGDYTVSYTVITDKKIAAPNKAPTKWEVWTVADKTATDNKTHRWYSEDGKVIDGALINIRKEKGTGRMVMDVATYPEVSSQSSTGGVRKTSTPRLKEIPFSAKNREILRTEYKFDPESFRNKYYPDWEKGLEGDAAETDTWSPARNIATDAAQSVITDAKPWPESAQPAKQTAVPPKNKWANVFRK